MMTPSHDSTIIQFATNTFHTVMPDTMTDTLGSAIPALTAHAISVSLPTWRDNIGYEEGERRVLDAMESGYPRFFIHRSVEKVRQEPKPYFLLVHDPYIVATVGKNM
jgi:hypothetical protein